MISGRCKFLKDWPEWDSSIHADNAQIERQGRAMTYHFTFDVNGLTETGRFSSTSDLPYYDTSLSQCTCHDFQDRRLPCKHIYRLAVELGVIEIIRRPAGGYSKELLSGIKSMEDVDTHPEQIKRMEKARGAKMAPISIDCIEQTAVFSGSGKKPYETTVVSCTCRDFFEIGRAHV